MLHVLRLHAEVVVAVWSAHWQAWCLATDGESRSGRVTRVDDGGCGKVVGLGFGQNSHSRNLPKSFLGKWSDLVSIA